MNSRNVNDIIECCLNGTASNPDKEWLKNEMLVNPELAREVDLRRRTNMILADKGVMELRNKLNAIEINKRSSGPVRRTVLSFTKYAAAVAMVLITTSIIFLQFRELPTSKIMKQYYHPYKVSTTVRSIGGDGSILMDNAISSYKSHDYPKAIEYLEQILGTDQDDMESMFLHGVANMEEKNYPVAGGSFKKVILHNDNLYIEDANWYLGLCYLMNGENDKAIKQFEFIASSKSRYNKEARKIIRKLQH